MLRGPRLVVAVRAQPVKHAAVRGHAVKAAEAGLAELQERGRRQQRVRARLRRSPSPHQAAEADAPVTVPLPIENACAPGAAGPACKHEPILGLGLGFRVHLVLRADARNVQCLGQLVQAAMQVAAELHQVLDVVHVREVHLQGHSLSGRTLINGAGELPAVALALDSHSQSSSGSLHGMSAFLLERQSTLIARLFCILLHSLT